MHNKQKILDFIENNKYDYVEISHRIHERPELGNEEIFASRTLIDQLRANRFEIETDIAGHATGFIATYDSDMTGPVKVVVLGCPAEEGGENGSAKASYVKAGVIDEIDVALMIHPGNETYRTINTLAVDVLDIKFYGRSAHASENADEALNALDAMISYFNGIAQLRQHIKKGQRVHGVILDGGKAANIIPDFTHARFYTRATSRKELDVLTEKVNQIARGAAIQTGCDFEFGPIQNGVNEFIKAPKLDDLFEKYATELGEEVIDDDFGYGSTDTGNVSHVVPTIHPHIKIGSRNLVGHTHRFREAAASLQGDQALIRGAKILALMGLELIENKPLLDEIIEEHTHIKGHVK